MFKDLSKMQKAGLVLGTIECIAGFGMAMYARHLVLKQADEVIQNIEDTTPNLDNIDFTIPKCNLNNLMDDED